MVQLTSGTGKLAARWLKSGAKWKDEQSRLAMEGVIQRCTVLRGDRINLKLRYKCSSIGSRAGKQVSKNAGREGSTL